MTGLLPVVDCEPELFDGLVRRPALSRRLPRSWRT
jgi:hypothetical protein